MRLKKEVLGDWGKGERLHQKFVQGPVDLCIFVITKFVIFVSETNIHVVQISDCP